MRDAPYNRAQRRRDDAQVFDEAIDAVLDGDVELAEDILGHNPRLRLHSAQIIDGGLEIRERALTPHPGRLLALDRS